MKAVLVIDMPDDAKAEDYRMRYGVFTNKGEEPFPLGEIAFECKDIDLRPLPQKLNETEYMKKVSSDGDWFEQVIGWNKCVDEILGETE